MYGVVVCTLWLAIGATVALLRLHLLLSCGRLHNLITFGGGPCLC
ncbi:MAG: hypothetical protein GPOALKHO_001217 [Sodalis sp.]|nr:MAG: hypothetical protein GPOALKHO_001217 [Sodalis sp.]